MQGRKEASQPVLPGRVAPTWGLAGSTALPRETSGHGGTYRASGKRCSVLNTDNAGRDHSWTHFLLFVTVELSTESCARSRHRALDLKGWGVGTNTPKYSLGP